MSSGSFLYNTQVSVKGITVKISETEKLFISKKWIRKVHLYATEHTYEEGRISLFHFVRVTYGESALDTLVINCGESNKEKAEEMFDSILRSLS
jgi:hypothetical protein